MKTRAATRSCRTRKRAVHFYSPGGVRRSHAAALHVRPAAAATEQSITIITITEIVMLSNAAKCL